LEEGDKDFTYLDIQKETQVIERKKKRNIRVLFCKKGGEFPQEEELTT